MMSDADLAKRLLAPLKLCNDRQLCFHTGDTWGHMSTIMCMYLSENDHGSYCKRDDAYVGEG